MQAMRAVRAEVGGDADLMEFVGVVERWNDVRLDAERGGTNMKDGFRVVDADAHVIEPGDLWARYFAPEYRDRAPRHLNLAFSVVTDGVSINTPDRWDPAATPEQLARRDERI